MLVSGRVVEHIFRSTGKVQGSVHTQLAPTGRSGLADRILGCNFFGVNEVVDVDGYVVMMMMMMMMMMNVIVEQEVFTSIWCWILYFGPKCHTWERAEQLVLNTTISPKMPKVSPGSKNSLVPPRGQVDEPLKQLSREVLVHKSSHSFCHVVCWKHLDSQVWEQRFGGFTSVHVASPQRGGLQCADLTQDAWS